MPEAIFDFPAIKAAAIGLRDTPPQDRVRAGFSNQSPSAVNEYARLYMLAVSKGFSSTTFNLPDMRSRVKNNHANGEAS